MVYLIMAKKFIPTPPCLLPKKDPRYKRWLKSLRKRPPPWCTGKTKENCPGLKKMSDTFKREKIDNFKKWREKARTQGLIPASYPPFKKDEDLAFLVGIALGDGNIYRYARTEELRISLGTDKPKLIDYTSKVVEKVFNKKPHIHHPKNINMVKVSVYQKNISKRLGVPAGNRRYSTIGIPYWAWKYKRLLLACLRGLYEAEASLCIHLPTCTYNFAFHNRNEKLLHDVYLALIKLKLHPEVRPIAIRLRRRDEVKYFEKLINFRQYDAG
jgi:hypothetical protein